MGAPDDIEAMVRARLRSLRAAQGLSLGELSTLANLSPSTISRVETGKRTLSLDVLVPLARALQVDLDALLEVGDDLDVVIRPVPAHSGGRTTWALSRPTASMVAVKVRLEPRRGAAELRVHPGRDWFYVLTGRVRLHLGERQLVVRSGEAAEFATMTPHAFVAVGGPAEMITVFDRDGQRAHSHSDGGNPQP